MKIRFLLLGTSLSLIPSLTSAQCVATQDCATLGYTETSCSGGSGVKCPFGNKWACFKSESEYEQEFCDKYGFTLSCNETGYTGAGKACNGKYNVCTCASGYEWKDGGCQKQILNGAQGDLYYCNDVVVGVKAGDMNFYVATQDLGQMDWDHASSECKSYVFCGEAKGILPTKDQLLSIYNNKSQVNSLLSTNGGTQLKSSYWSSSQQTCDIYYPNYCYYYYVSMSNGSMSTSSDRTSQYPSNTYVRPILTSW